MFYKYLYRAAYSHPQFNTDVMKPLMIDNIKDQEIQNLSGFYHSVLFKPKHSKV